MKKLLLICLPCFLLTFCVSLPNNSVESGTVTLTVGPFFNQHATVAGVKKDATGTVITNFEGSTSYLGVVTTTQSFHDLHVDAAGNATPAAAPTPAAK